VLDVLAKQLGVRGIFSDWPPTTTFYELHGDEVSAESQGGQSAACPPFRPKTLTVGTAQMRLWPSHQVSNKEWTSDAARRKKAGVPRDLRFKTKPEIALEQIGWACLPRGSH
jgi:hypothetical protein